MDKSGLLEVKLCWPGSHCLHCCWYKYSSSKNV